jgi:hypothetical protein
MKNKHVILVILAIVLSFTGFAQSDSPKFELDGYVKYMQTNAFTDVNDFWINDNLIHNRLDFSYYPTNWLSAKVSVRNRFFYGQQVSMMYVPGVGNMYAEQIDQHTGFIDMSWNYFENKSTFFNTSIDRAFIDIQKGKWNITAGRHRINWGQTFVWNANDIFNAYSYFDFDYEEKPGSDAIRVQYNIDFASRIDIAAAINNDSSLTAAALYSFNKFNYDFQVMSGVFQSEDIVIGLGYAGSLFYGGFRGEISYFHPMEDLADTTGVIAASIGYDYVLKKGTMLTAEVLFNTSAPKDADFNITDFYNLKLSAKNLSFARFSAVAMVSHPISPIVTASLSAMYSPTSNFFYTGPSVSVSMADNFMIDLNVQFFSSDIPKEQGGKGTYVFLRGRWSF